MPKINKRNKQVKQMYLFQGANYKKKGDPKLSAYRGVITFIKIELERVEVMKVMEFIEVRSSLGIF